MFFEFPLCIILKFITNEPIRYTQLQIINELNPFSFDERVFACFVHSRSLSHLRKQHLTNYVSGTKQF